MKKRIGLIGFGTIGHYIFNRVLESDLMDISFILETDHSKIQQIDSNLLLPSLDALHERATDLVVEVANAKALSELGPKILKHHDLLLFSLCSFANKEFQEEMEIMATELGRKIYIPHGAIVGLDGIHDGRKVIDRVCITTTKNPKNLDVAPEIKAVTTPTVLYDGPTRGACLQFPRNVNSHASIALAGLGFDRTWSKIIGDPDTNKMTHIIEVEGNGLHWRILVESTPTGRVSGAYTPESAYQTLRRICVEERGLQIV